LLNPDSQWRIELARQIVTHYNAAAVMLVGSPVMGLADAYSDIDMLMFWHSVPTEAERVAIAQSLGGRIVELGDTSAEPKDDPALQSQSEAYVIGNYDLKIDITHITIASQQKLIDDVVLRYETHEYKLGAVEGLSHCMALTGQALIAKWQEEIRLLPDALAHKLMRQYAQMWAQCPLRDMLIRRGDVLYANRALNDIAEKVVYMLVVVQGQYPPLRLKHLPWIIEALELKPTDMLERITQICSLAPAEALPIAAQLVEETFTIVAAQGYDINNARTHFNSERQANNERITLNEETNNA
jgi:hypothetical protein